MEVERMKDIKNSGINSGRQHMDSAQKLNAPFFTVMFYQMVYNGSTLAKKTVRRRETTWKQCSDGSHRRCRNKVKT